MISRSFRIRLEPLRVGGLSHLSGGERERAKDDVDLRRVEMYPVEFKKECGGGKADSFVAINERMILHETKSVGRCEIK